MWFEKIRQDIQAVFDRDPAARSTLEVILCYPGLHAIWGYRISSWMWFAALKLLAASFLTWCGSHGVEIIQGRLVRISY
jgi:serine acetyltransferase